MPGAPPQATASEEGVPGSPRSRVARNVTSQYVNRAVGVAISIVLLPVIVNGLGPQMFGAYVLISTTTQLFLSADLGVGTSVVRGVAEATARRDDRLASRVVTTSMAFFVAFAALLAVVVAATFALFWGSFSFPSDARVSISISIAVVIVGQIVIGMPLALWRPVLAGLDRLDLFSLVMTMQYVGRAIGIVAVLLAGGGLLGIVVVETVVIVAMSLGAAIIARRLSPGIRVARSNFDLALLREILKFSIQVFLIGLMSIVILQTDSLVIGTALPVAAVGLYAAGFRVYQVLRDVGGAMLSALVPAGSMAASVGGDDRLRRLLVLGTRVNVATITAASLPAIIFADDLLRVWVGDRYSSAATVTRILLAGLLLNSTHLGASGLLMGVGEVGRYLRLHVVWAGSNLALGLVLVRTMGIEGVALATTLPLVFLEPFYLAIALKRFAQPTRSFLKQGIAQPFAIGAVIAVPLFALDQVLLTDLPASVSVLAFLAGVLAYPLAFLMIVGQREERDRAASIIRRLSRRTSPTMAP